MCNFVQLAGWAALYHAASRIALSDTAKVALVFVSVANAAMVKDKLRSPVNKAKFPRFSLPIILGTNWKKNKFMKV